MHLARAVESAGHKLYLTGRVPGSFYDGYGQEATSVGVALMLRDEDIACPLIRDLGVHLVRGVTPETVLRHYLGRAGAPMDGRDGNVHLGSFEHGTIPMVSHLPEILPVGIGMALARNWRGEDSVAVCFCGDGAANVGVWHEAMNLAAVWHVPVVVVVERNGWSYMTSSAAMLSVDRVSLRAQGYGAGAIQADGNDVLAVLEAARAAVELARSAGGPVILECDTYRMHGHGAHDSQSYVPQHDLEVWAARDPLLRWRTAAGEMIGWTDDDQARMVCSIDADVAAAVEGALGAPQPDPAGLLASVFAA